MFAPRVLSAIAGLSVALHAARALAPEPDGGSSTPLAVWTWGSNLAGQLGRIPANQHVPGAVAGLDDVIALAGGLRHTLALRSDGTVWAWGENTHGQLGVPGARLSLAPIPVAGLSGITAIAAGGEHSIAYRAADGKLWLWGSNEFGQAAQPIQSPILATPTEVTPPAPLVEIGAGGFHTLLLDERGDVWGAGANIYGELGNGTTDETATFVKASVARIVDIVTGLHHDLAVDADGVVWGWGLNSFGQLGRGVQNGWTEAMADPAPVIGLPPIARVAAGQLHSLALARDGRVFGWGYNTSGQVGDGSVLPANTGRLAPAELALSGVVDIVGGGIHSLALDASGALWIWGSSARGTLGNNSIDDVRVPTQLGRLNGATAIAAGGAHTLVLAPAPQPLSVRSAGHNDGGQLGDGTSTDKNGLVSVALDDVIQVSAGHAHSLALLGDGRVLSWGDNEFGQVGVSGSHATPVDVAIPRSASERIVAVAAGGFHSLALRSDGSVWAWGDGRRDQLGPRAGLGSPTPVRVVALTDIVAIAAGRLHSVAVRNDGSLWAWGDNTCGQLGEARSVLTSGEPVQVTGIAVASAVAAGYCHSLASSELGVLHAWGSNSTAQLGNDSLSDSRRTVHVAGIGGVTSFAAGAYHGLAVVSGGTVVAWGEPNSGALGTGTSYLYWTPRAVAGLSDIDTVVGGAFHSLALSEQGVAYGWGIGWRGQLALGAPGERQSPIVIATRVGTAAGGRAHTLVGAE